MSAPTPSRAVAVLRKNTRRLTLVRPSTSLMCASPFVGLLVAAQR